MDTMNKTTEPTDEQKREAKTRRIARAGETEFAAIVRNRSGVDAGEIDFGLKNGSVIDDLSDADKQSLVDTAYALAEACESATGKRRTAKTGDWRDGLPSNAEEAAIDERILAHSAGHMCQCPNPCECPKGASAQKGEP